MSEHSPSIGMECTDIDKLREITWVSGVKILDLAECAAGNYMPPPFVVAAPNMETFGKPTDEELERLVAGPDTEMKMRIFRAPAALGSVALRAERTTTTAELMASAPQQLVPGLQGRFVHRRLDRAGAPSTSMNEQDRPVGLHIDAREPDSSLIVGHVGPGEKWHHIAPSLTKQLMGGVSHWERAYIRDHVDPDSRPLYWFKLPAPDEDGNLTCMISPVSTAMHDGSMYGIDQDTTSFFYLADHVDEARYPSAV